MWAIRESCNQSGPESKRSGGSSGGGGDPAIRHVTKMMAWSGIQCGSRLRWKDMVTAVIVGCNVRTSVPNAAPVLQWGGQSFFVVCRAPATHKCAGRRTVPLLYSDPAGGRPETGWVRDKKVDERGNAPIRSRERKRAVAGTTRTWHRPAPQRHTVWPPKRAVASIAIGCCRGAPIASDSVPPASCDSDGGWHRS